MSLATSRVFRARCLGWVCMGLLVACPESPPPTFEGVLALSAWHDASETPHVLLEWKKAYAASAFSFRVYAAVDRDPIVDDSPAADRIATLPSATLALDVDPRTLFNTAPPADFETRDYRFVVVAVDEQGQSTASAVESIVPARAATCGCSLAPTVTAPRGEAVPLLADCRWTQVEGAESCRWTARTDVVNADPGEPDPYGLLRTRIYFHPDASAHRPVVVALHGGTGYAALGIEYASVALASHAVVGEGGTHDRGALVLAPEMRDAFAGTPGTTAEGEEIERVASVIAITSFVEDVVTPGTSRYSPALAALFAADFGRMAIAGGSDGGITSAALAATPPGPLPFPHGDLLFPEVPFRSRIRAAFIVAPGATASPHAMNLKDGPTAIGGQMTMPVAVLSDDMDLTDSNSTAEKAYAYMTVDDPDPSTPEKDRYFYRVHNGQDDVIPSRNVHVCLADPRGFPDAYLCDDQFSVEVLGLPIQPSMLDHHRLLRHHLRRLLDRYLWGDSTITHASLVAPWYSPSHPTPDPANPASGYDADGYPVPVVVEATGPAS